MFFIRGEKKKKSTTLPWGKMCLSWYVDALCDSMYDFEFLKGFLGFL